MKILVVCGNNLYIPLSGSFVHNQVKSFARLGQDVMVVIPTSVRRKDHTGTLVHRITRYRLDGVDVVYFPFLSLSHFGAHTFNKWTMHFVAKLSLLRILKEFSPDVIHAHFISDSGAGLGVFLKKQLRCPLIVTTHGSDTSIPYERGRMSWLRQQCDRADSVVAVSSALAEKVQKSGTSTPVSTILNGSALENLPQTAAKRPCSVIQVGHLAAQKRTDVTLRAFAQLYQRHPEAALTLVGQGGEREKLEALCRELTVARSVRFTGQLPNEDVLAEMAKAQFFCMPSVREGFGIVYLEAMASGCITIGTEGEGIADLIESGKNGFLVPPDDPSAITEVIEWCLAHPAEANAIAEQGRRDAAGLTWERNAQCYLDLIQSLCKETQP